MEKLNILIVHNQYKFRGGEDIVAENEGQLLSDHGHNVFYYIRNNNELDKMGLFGKLLLPFTTIFSMKSFFEIKSLIKKHHIQVVHVHNTVPLISSSVYIAAKSSKCKIVQTLHNFRFLCPNGLFFRNGKICQDCISKGKFKAIKNSCYRNSKLQTLLLIISQKISKFFGIYKKINKVICLTDFSRDQFTNFFPIDKLVVKPNFVPECNKPRINVNQRSGFVYVGRIEEYKGVFELADFFINHSEFDISFIGTGSDFENLKNKVQNAKNIKLLGLIDHDKTIELISKSRGLIIPSKWFEGFPMTIIEALSVSTPVLGSNIGNVGSICSQCYGTFDINDNKKLTDLLVALQKNEFLDKQMDKSYELFKSKWSSEVNYQQLLEIYTKF